ncbi:16S rRNA (guanine(966)-N(2))-methyltransferase RsmD [Buchnera aphidicola (Muscaphis stroyani)]|uniref:Ribosomal RNA small subunit methyltransferase D n=1 Tax=Buchnera aphidicola (Muscaphis stroyani) TaxID=1241869 RepID=A0A4D6YIB0_9GAMM|nr:16S rRNA (guanine(966)-N(2))-methyltransferase RsmD [Buchnera aphidicola]QCI24145.1 16S rRNA (guanine(966)-N(2))-methyltransferase RsmD [Buchnera aphidicola (Muscaphis stroyani)]
MNNYFSKKKGKIYIISGKLKRQKISLINTPNIKPTTNRIRETLFNWLERHIKNARCLDCFSGSGALGIEAISRHAAFVTSLEINKKTAYKLTKNVKKLNISNMNVIHTDTFHWLKKRRKPYDIIFVDPPYKKQLIKKTLNLLEDRKWLKEDSLVYIEKEKKHSLVMPKNWILYKKKNTRKIEFYLYIFKSKNI